MQLESLARVLGPSAEGGRTDAFPPLIDRSDHRAPSVFRPENMLREARRQKGIGAGEVPVICVLDPDGDLVDYVRAELDARQSSRWACYHTKLWEWERGGIRYGIVGYAVGGPFSVLVAEQLFVSGCSFLVSVASAGQIADQAARSYHILVERSLRDEGTSYHYLPATAYAEADPGLIDLARTALAEANSPVLSGATWTTDAPFRETEGTIARRKAEGLLAVEMESAALYAFAAARKQDVLCLCHVTNQLGRAEGDFEKGHRNGAEASMRLIDSVSQAWMRNRSARI
jgi:uridine phosphorylase